MDRRNWQVTIVDQDGDTQEYKFVARDAWTVLTSIQRQMQSVGEFYGHAQDATLSVAVEEMIADADMSGAIRLGGL